MVNRWAARSGRGGGWRGWSSCIHAAPTTGGAVDGRRRQHARVHLAAPGRWWRARGTGRTRCVRRAAAGGAYTRRLPGGGAGGVRRQRPARADGEPAAAGDHASTGRTRRPDAGARPGAHGGGARPRYYNFVYERRGAADARARRRAGRATRTVDAGARAGDRRVTSIPTRTSGRCGSAIAHDAGGDGAPRTDRRGTPQHVHLRPRRAGWRRDAAGAGAGRQHHRRPSRRWRSKGLGASVPLAQAYTRLDGPRTDVADRTWFWRRGGARRGAFATPWARETAC